MSEESSGNSFRAAAPPGAERAIDRSSPRREENPNSRSAGFRPAPDWTEQARQAQQKDGGGGQQQGEASSAQGQGERQQQDTAPQTIRIGENEYSHDQVNDALRFKAEHDIRKTGLPTAPEKYQVALPADFKAPEGVNFELDPNSADIKNFQRLAHARGLDQETFSEALGIYAANRLGEQQQLGTARAAEMGKLGSAADNRITAVETWLKSQVGAKANIIVAQMRNYPVAGMVEMFEQLARNASNQGSAGYSQSGRADPDPAPRVPEFTGANFAEVRAAQDALNTRLRGSR